mgnify:CR=1 FL=1
MYIVNDKLGSPTYTNDFAENVKLLIEKNQRGLFNMVCSGLTSRFEVATELVQLLGLKDDIKIKEVSSDYFSDEYFVDRPGSEQLVNKRLDKLGINLMRDWKVALMDYIRNYYIDYL